MGKFKNFFLKFNPASAVGRNAYLLLVKTNFKGSALIPYRAAKDKSSKAWKNLAKYWQSLGGNPRTLDLAVQQGMRLEYKNHPNSHAEKDPVFKFDGSDSFDPATASAALAAVPVILGVIKNLKKSGVEVPEEYKTGIEGAANEGAENIIKANNLQPGKDGVVVITDKHLKSTQTGAKGTNTKKSGLIILVGAVIILAVIYSKKK
jgi:hypothetical protein